MTEISHISRIRRIDVMINCAVFCEPLFSLLFPNGIDHKLGKKRMRRF